MIKPLRTQHLLLHIRRRSKEWKRKGEKRRQAKDPRSLLSRTLRLLPHQRLESRLRPHQERFLAASIVGLMGVKRGVTVPLSITGQHLAQQRRLRGAGVAVLNRISLGSVRLGQGMRTSLRPDHHVPQATQRLGLKALSRRLSPRPGRMQARSI